MLKNKQQELFQFSSTVVNSSRTLSTASRLIDPRTPARSNQVSMQLGNTFRLTGQRRTSSPLHFGSTAFGSHTSRKISDLKMGMPVQNDTRRASGVIMSERKADKSPRKYIDPLKSSAKVMGGNESTWNQKSRQAPQIDAFAVGLPSQLSMTANSQKNVMPITSSSAQRSSRRASLSNVQMNVTYEIKQNEQKVETSAESSKPQQEFLEVYQDEIFAQIKDENAQLENQIKIEAIIDKCNGDMAMAYDKIMASPELYKQIVDNLDDQINNCYKFYYKEGKTIAEKIERVFQAIGECLEKSEEFQEEYAKKPKERGLQGYYLSKFGSSLNGTLTKNSDLDMTLISDDSSFNIGMLIKAIKKSLQENETEPGRYEFDKNEYGNAILFHDTVEDLEVDFVINRTANVINSDLILQYSKTDIRFRKLMYFFKDWLKVEKYLPEEQLNSFSIYNLLIAYMQKEKMLPNLQSLANISFQEKDDSNEFLNDLVKPSDIRPQQIRSKGKLMFDCHNMYYDTFEDVKASFVKAGLIDADVTAKQSPLDFSNFDETATLKSPAEILIGFFRYYGQIHNPDLGIDISQYDEQVKYTVDPSLDPKSTLLSLYYQGQSFPMRNDMLKIVTKQYDERKYLKTLDLPQDFMDNIQKQYQMTWNEIGPWELSKDQIYDRHYKLIRAEKEQFLKDQKELPYYIVDPFDHLYNPARCIKKYSSNDWPNNGMNEEGNEEKEPETLYPVVWNNALKCVFRNKMKQKFMKKKKSN